MGRWDRTPIELLEQQVRDLTAQLEQARAASDLALVKDMLNRSGMRYSVESIDDQTVLCVTNPFGPWTEFYLYFMASSGQFVSLGGGGSR